MQNIKIEGPNKLSGTIKIGGAKNSAVALIPAAILSDGIVTIDNIPNITDIEALIEIMEYLGASIKREEEKMIIDCSKLVNKDIPEAISKKLRASYYFMSALLGKHYKVEMFFPGGCSIGARPIDQTLKSFEALGAIINEDNNKFNIYADELIGSHIYLDMPSVGATINAILVSAKAKGITIIENAAKEPEIVNLVTFLNNMGAKIRGAGTSEITITGVTKLGSAFIEVIPDRIEAGTYIMAGVLAGSNLKIENIIPEHLDSFFLKLKEMNVPFNIGDDYVEISKAQKMNKVNITTQGFPGFATDLQQPFTILLTQAEGMSKLEETIYENRFKHIKYLVDMGANIEVTGRKIIVLGKTKLIGKKVVATDLRAGAALILAGLIAEGTTYIKDIDHILRGYENIVEKLQDVGAKIEIIEI